MPSTRRPGAPADLEELRPQLFIIHNPAAAPILRGEGDREGDRFQLTSWRRDGLLARLRVRGFTVHTLENQIAALPGLPYAVRLGPPVVRALAAGERISYFALDAPGWRPAPPAPGAPGSVRQREGGVIRRRKGRGPGAYYLVVPGTLRPLPEDEALRRGYAAADGAFVMVGIAENGELLMPDLPLPPEHRVLLGRIATRTPDGWRIPREHAELVDDLLARLGLQMRTRS